MSTKPDQAQPGVKTSCVDYATLLEQITVKPVRRIPLRKSTEQFARIIEEMDQSQVGAWGREPRALHAELRGVLLGGATGFGSETSVQDNCLRLTPDAYRRHRTRLGRIDERSMRVLLRTAERLPAGTLEEVFPELAAARKAIEVLDTGDGVPLKYGDVDRVVIDEAQDLTLTEMAVIAKLCRGVEKQAGRRPRLLVAGDEGQTVRPSGFSWATTRELLDRTVGRPSTYVLDAQVRCPERIDELCRKVSTHYKEIDKQARPHGQHNTTTSTVDKGETVHVVVNDDNAARVIGRLAEIPSTAIVCATAEVPDWIPEDLRQQVLTPAEAKGLEYQTVCVVNLRTGCAVAARGTIANSDERLNQEIRRNAIDQVRVAVTRSTDMLAVIEHGEEAALRNTTDKTIDFSPDDLIEHLENDSATPEERALALAEECRQLRGENSQRALMRGHQAVNLLGHDNDMGRATDPGIRETVSNTVLRAIGNSLLEEPWSEEELENARALGLQAIGLKYPENTQDDVETATAAKAKRPRTKENSWAEEELLDGLIEWQNGNEEGAARAADRLSLLQGADGSQGCWADAALTRRSSAVAAAIDNAAKRIAAMEYRKPSLKRWLKAIGITDTEATAERIAGKAFDHLIGGRPRRDRSQTDNRILNAAEAILATLNPHALREAQVEEAEGNVDTALSLYRRAEAHDDEARIIRDNALWEHAGDALDETGIADREWLLALERTTSEMPPGIIKRLSGADTRRLIRKTMTQLAGEMNKHTANTTGRSSSTREHVKKR